MNYRPDEPVERLRAAETSCLIERCNSSCISIQASSILCILFILCCSLTMSILKSLILSHTSAKGNRLCPANEFTVPRR
ncbi:hypothetical protein MtrunA17_Chr2g0320501 [Medicago truncatula]|uniref:Transmembrane protein n=1 Tax=Medicago truncatula TaxID=3880 RepID=A0A396JG82_MEDTR|nr:hypothetical protein MtrunA17_Chr2g0320501 [Medicago truncatula]